MCLGVGFIDRLVARVLGCIFLGCVIILRTPPIASLDAEVTQTIPAPHIGGRAWHGLENTALGFKAVTLFYDLLRSSFPCR